MAAGQRAIADLIRINDQNVSGGVVDELLQAVPFIRQISSLTASNGSQHKFFRYDDAPPADFRALNTGRAHGTSKETLVTIDCQIVDASITPDTKTADGYRFGTEAYLNMEGMRSLRSALQVVERQCLNGTSGSPWSNASGFEGLTDALGALSNEMVESAGGSTNLTSVYVIRSADPLDSEALVLGNDGNIQIAPAVRQAKGDSTLYGVYFVEIASWYAYQHAGKYTAARLANVDSASATPVVTDDALGKLIAKFPVDRPATHIVYNRTAWEQHRASRTATNATGSEAPFPMDAYGLPIIVTDQISNAEDAVS